MQDLQSPVGHGWELEDDCLKLVYMTKDPAPRSLITRKLLNVYLEKLSRSDAGPTVSSGPWMGARR